MCLLELTGINIHTKLVPIFNTKIGINGYTAKFHAIKPFLSSINGQTK